MVWFDLLNPMRLVWLLSVLLLCCMVTFSTCAQQKSNSKPIEWGYKVVATYPHDAAAFTQGLTIVDGEMYEGTGGNGNSWIRRVDWKTGEVQTQARLNPQYFGEGITILGDRLYQLTWQNRLGLIYDTKTFQFLQSFAYTGEGWGLTHDGKNLIMSDGTSSLRFLDPSDFHVVKKLVVKSGNQKISQLNELEWVDGEIWSNVWHDDRIVRISPIDGSVIGWINLAGLYPRGSQDKERVLNGIAYDQQSKKVYVTGKNWPNLFEIEIVR